MKRGMTADEIIAEAKAKDEGGVASEGGVETYSEAQARKETALANLRELEHAEKLAQLVDADAAAREWATVAQSIRDNLLSAPDRIASDLPYPPDVKRNVRDLLMKELRKILAGLSDEIRVAA